jgi:hypothetical protein
MTASALGVQVSSTASTFIDDSISSQQDTAIRAPRILPHDPVRVMVSVLNWCVFLAMSETPCSLLSYIYRRRRGHLQVSR